ncbi:GntR family transcriptional regulator [Chitinibacter bivalviorum]|uniref:GntR family transcriptional regulator n=1 Tax=Chitinibacter bivalviorum TaxID=2739434 RepID=A0A7H9BJ89_9NEIS|nr:GntR family transcriptional regulator [Chitinibacter bivalviorum]QLG88539.1 GntR family transcriptional regulator [Chitinibacter bivalviorum]
MFVLNPNLPTPIYRQIQDQVRRLIAGGQLAPGDALPSVREVAEAQAVNPMTISKAYSLLEAEGLLERQRGKPMTVAALSNQSRTAQAQIIPLLQDLIVAARQLGLSDSELIQALSAELQQQEQS